MLPGLAIESESHISIEGSIVRLRKGSGSIGSSPNIGFNDALFPDIKSDSGMVLWGRFWFDFHPS